MPKYTDEALDRMADAAAQMIIARLDGDAEGAAAEERKAQTIARNPRSRKNG